MSEIELKDAYIVGELRHIVATGEGDMLWINRHHAAALLSAIDAPAPQWQPIESAPKDGDILAWDGDDIRVTHWHTRPSGAGGWYEQVDQYEVFFWSPTHWQPLPAPPEERP